ncbi:caspase family protein [Pseudosulfitobacter sp. DSM 107133]|uniref:caspase family protein n=1 Tax=Pseudosulfitobacter sp. DSM 107133 TaxID=2883100 RepID=UPI000DF48C13|nr:caspase family protein [Pseudosulfitobacter sp. DSM 107133]UOA28957.1 Secretory immunoglobulin A-binding protein EsiB [Pseudosulfitobacter sp. DSM 107133]
MLRLALLLAFWLTGAAWAETRLALVIGNSTYTRISALDNPRNDALDISVALEGLGFDVMLEIDVTRERFGTLIETFGTKAESADVVLLYYAGHGFQVDGRNYLVPTDAAIGSAADVASQTMLLDRLLQVMERSDGVKLVFLDACRDNPFGTVVDDPRLGTGLARVGTAANFLFSYATQPDNVAYDGTGRNSFFTEAVLHHIYTPGQEVAQMMIGVRRDVLAATGGKQIPWENSSLTRTFQFNTNPETISEESMLYQIAVDERDGELLALYLDRYPEGAHAQEALAFLDTGTRTRALGAVDEDARAQRWWELARRSRMRPLLELYIERYPDADNRAEAQRLLSNLPRPEDAAPGKICERLATHPRDATAENRGVPFSRLQQNAFAAIQACSAAASRQPELPHYTALLARATAASGDLERAVVFYVNAAERGDLRAMVSLAQLTERGAAVPQDPARALALYERAAQGGSHDAMINLAITLLETGADQPRALALLQRASNEGSAKATFNLGVLAQDGVGAGPEEALAYFRKAAQDGEPEGFRAAAILLDEGRGVPRDPQSAAIMLLRGAAEDRGEVVQQLSTDTDQWTPQTIRAVQGLLKEAGYYTAAIDGLPGSNFTAALEKWRNGGFKPAVLQ